MPQRSAHVRVEVVGEPQQPATFRRQMPEVGVPSWVRRYAAVRIEDRAADDAALDLGARVDADGASRVIHRVEEVVARRGIARLAPPRGHTDVLETHRVEAMPRLTILGMRLIRMPAVRTRASGADRIARSIAR